MKLKTITLADVEFKYSAVSFEMKGSKVFACFIYCKFDPFTTCMYDVISLMYDLYTLVNEPWYYEGWDLDFNWDLHVL